MKKTAMRVSGNITLITFFLLFLISIIGVCSAFNVKAVTDVVASSDIMQIICVPFNFIFVEMPVYLLSLATISLPAEISTIFAIAFAVFSFLMFLWGIKEVKIANRDNQNFAKCKKTCAFMMFTKFMFFAYLIAVAVMSVLDESIANVTLIVSDAVEIPYFFLILTAVLAVIAF